MAHIEKVYLDRYGSPWQKIREESATKKYRLGERYAPSWDPLGRVFHYALAGAAITPGKLLTTAALSGATTTLQTKCPIAVASAIGDKRIYVTRVTTTQAASLFEDGIAAFHDVSATPDEFSTCAIKDNSSIDDGVTGYIDLYEDDVLPVALTTSDFVDLTVNPWKNVVEFPVTTAVGNAIGVAQMNVTSGYYFWAQTWGPCAVIQKLGPIGLGQDACVDLSLAGSITAQTAAVATQNIGFTLNIGTDEFCGTVMLHIAP